MIKVSVIMSVYNGGRYLRETIDSVLNQTFKHFEFIIVNDGSTDSTSDILESFSDPRMHIVTQENMGISKSKNTAIALTSGEFIAVIDADDIWMPEKIEKQLNFLLENGDVGLVGTSAYTIDKKGNILNTFLVKERNEDIQSTLLTKNCFIHSSIIVKKSALEAINCYNTVFRYSLDYDLVLRISEQFKIWNLQEVLTCWRLSENGVTMSRNMAQKKYAELAVLLAKERRVGRSENISGNWARIFKQEEKGIIQSISFLSSIINNWSKSQRLSRYYYGTGCAFLSKGDTKKAIKYYFISLKYNCFYIKTYIFLILTVIPFKLRRLLLQRIPNSRI